MLMRSKEHLESVDETYLEHMGHAFGFGRRMVAAGLACLVHGIMPGLFVTTGSSAIRELHDRMVVNRRKTHAVEHRQAG